MRSDGLKPLQSLPRGQRSAKPRIKATRNFAQSVCDELAASNGQTAPENDGGMLVTIEVSLPACPRSSAKQTINFSFFLTGFF
jgi:hypothetical protein